MPDEVLTIAAGPQAYSVLAGYVNRFVQAWESAPQPPCPKQYLPPSGALRRLALVELIKVDLEYRWLLRNEPRHVEDYLAEYPELRDGGIPCDLLYEEYHIRRQAGLCVDPAEYFARFPDQAEQLRRMIPEQAESVSTTMSKLREADVLRRLQPGDRLDDFDLIAWLGKGAFASVFLARQISMQRLVALKISANRGTEPQTLAQFDHDHIVRVYDQHELADQGVRLLYMQYLPGGTLKDVVDALRAVPADQRSGLSFTGAVDQSIERRGESRPVESAVRAVLDRMTWPQTVCWMGSRLASALDCAHRQGVLHRDIKPANVLLTAEAVPKLADFNISYSSKLAGVTPATYFGGSLPYMSPEQLEASNPAHSRRADSLDGRSDLYSLGVVLWELLTGDRPFRDEQIKGNFCQVLEHMVTARRQGLSHLPPLSCRSCPPGVYRVVNRCLAADPAERWSNGADLARQLHFCTDPEIQDYLFPPQRNWRCRVKRFLFASLLLATLLPSALAAMFNFVYNWREIISHMNPAAESRFMLVQMLINGTAFPLGLVLIGYLTLSVSRAVKRAEGLTEDTARQAQQRALWLGHFAAFTCISLWALAGLVYPVSMQLGEFHLPASTYAHFFVSLLLCGLFAVSLTYFSVTVLTLRAAFPVLLADHVLDRKEAVNLAIVARGAWIYLTMSAFVPMFATMMLVAVNSPNVRWYLAVISISGLVAFAGVVVLFRTVLRDLATLTRIASAARP